MRRWTFERSGWIAMLALGLSLVLAACNKGGSPAY
jgi:hypothetical protein